VPRKAAAAKPAPRTTKKPRSGKPAAAAPARRRVSLAKATLHLHDADPVLAGIIDTVGRLPSARTGRPEREDHYGALVRSIVGQQLGVGAPRALPPPVLARRGPPPPTPQEVLAQDPEELRAAAGLSRAKVGFLRSLAEHVLSGELELERLDQLSDEDAIAELVAVKGLGVWTAHMFLMFHLERPDVLAVGDLGIRRAIERAYGLGALPDVAEIERIAEPWRPHRTLACRYLWRSLDNEPG
jgi:DNA-3-methyladenine glycosylase II